MHKGFLRPVYGSYGVDSLLNILVTGGLGYIGSQACVALVQAGHGVVVLDDLSNSQRSVREQIEKIAGSEIHLEIGDIRDEECLCRLFNEFDFSVVFHFAGLKSPLESVAVPVDYYDCNVNGTLSLLKQMKRSQVKTLVFSSSASVYGIPAEIPVTEKNSVTSPSHPYGRSKLVVENILADLSSADREWRIACLRYFNPVGAHPSGLLGENPQTIPCNLMPYIVRVASGRLEKLSVFGVDYSTVDGTGVRDYIHVQDLVEGHIAALNYLESNSGFITLNLGTGQGVSVLQLIHEFENVTEIKIPFVTTERRAGDVAECWADASLAENMLGWKATRTLADMCRDAWRWEQQCLQKSS